MCLFLCTQYYDIVLQKQGRTGPASQRIIFKTQRQPFPLRLGAHNDVVNWDVDELHEKTDESHNEKTDAGGRGDSGKFLSIRLGAFAEKVVAIFSKKLQVLHRAIIGTRSTHFIVSVYV